MRFLIVLSAFAVLLVGCNADAPHGYFPLVEGLAWHYHVTRSDPLGSHETSRLIMTNLGPTTLDQSRVFERRNSFGSH